MKIERLRFAGALAAVLLTPTALVTAAVGWTPDSPRDQVWEHCVRFSYPDGLAPHVEAVNVSGETTLFPLGFTCTYDNPNTSAAPIMIAHPQWRSTLIASLASVGALAGVTVALAGVVIDSQTRRRDASPMSV